MAVFLITYAYYYFVFMNLMFTFFRLFLYMLQLTAFIYLVSYIFYIKLQSEQIDIYQNCIVSPKIGEIRKSKSEKPINVLSFDDIDKIQYIHKFSGEQLMIIDKKHNIYQFRYINFQDIIPILKNILLDKFEEVRE